MSILDAISRTHRDQQLIFTTPELPWRASCDSIFKINTRTNALEEQKEYTIELELGVSKEIYLSWHVRARVSISHRIQQQ